MKMAPHDGSDGHSYDAMPSVIRYEWTEDGWNLTPEPLPMIDADATEEAIC